MFSLAFVILPISQTAPAEAIAQALARFRRGGPGDVPHEWLQFDDYTADVRAAHEKTFTFSRIGERGLRTEEGSNWLLEIGPILEEIDRRGGKHWRVRFADYEPNLDRFANRFVRPLERHPVTRGFGHWRNGLGQWDWWDLGGRFDGAITRTPKRPGRSRSRVWSGPSRGRAMLEQFEGALIEALNQDTPEEIDVHADNNVELVSRLLEDIRNGDDASTLPGALVLPPGFTEDRLRWIGNWPDIGPIEAVEALGLRACTRWRQIVQTVYEHFPDHWAAAVAYHH